MMKKRFLTIVTTALLCLVTIFSATACGGYTINQIDEMIAQLQTELSTNEADFNKKINDLIADYQEKDDELSAQILANETAIANLKTDYDAKLAALQTQITANRNAIENATGGFVGSLEDLVTVEELNDLKAEYDATILELTQRVTATETAIARVESEYKTALESYVTVAEYGQFKAEYLQKVLEIEGKITANETAITALDNKYIAELEKYVAQTDFVAYKNQMQSAIDDLQAQIEESETAITALDNKYIAELEKLATKTALEALQSKHNDDVAYIISLMSSSGGTATEEGNALLIKNLRDEYEAKVIELVASDTSNLNKINELTSKHDSDKAALVALIQANEKAINDHKTAYANKVSELASAIAGNESEIATLRADYEEDLLDLQTQITACTNSLNEHKTAYNNKVNELASAIEGNESAIATLRSNYESAIATLRTDLNNVDTELAGEIEEYAAQLETLAGQVSANANAITSLRNEYEAKIEALEAKDTALQNQINSLNGGYSGDTSALVAEVELLKESLTNLRNTHASEINALTTKHNDEITALNNLINEIKAVDNTQNDKITELENKVNNLINGIDRVVTFNYADGRANSTVTVKNGEKVTQPTNPTRTGYTFDGWYGGVYGDEKWVFIGYTVTENITLTAKWIANTYTVRFETGVEGQTVANKTATFNSEFALPTAPSKTGYTFAGWFNGNDKLENNEAWTLTADTTLTAKWNANTYTVSYNLNGGEGAIEDEQAVFGANYEVASAPSRTDYNFVGWFNGDDKVVGGDYLIANDITLTAKWELAFNNVIFNGNSADGGSTATMKIGVDQTQKINANGFTKAGYIFAGWATSENGAVVYYDGDIWTASEDQNTTLYARWVDASANLGAIQATTVIKTYLDDTNANAQFDFAAILKDELFSGESASAVAGTLAYNSVKINEYTLEGGIYTVAENQFKASNDKQLSGETELSVDVIYYYNGQPTGIKTVTAKLVIVTKVLRTSEDIDGWYALAQQDWAAKFHVNGKNIAYGGYFELGNNIVYTGNYVSPYPWFEGCDWTSTGGFQGTFDGCGYAIDGFVTNNFQGFIGGVLGRNGIVRNLALVNVKNQAFAHNVIGQNIYGGIVENVYVQNDIMYYGSSPNGASSFYFNIHAGSTVRNVVIEVDSLSYTPSSYANTSNEHKFTNVLGNVATGVTPTNVIAITAGEGTYYQGSKVMSAGSVYGYNTYADAVTNKSAYASVVTALTQNDIWTTNKDGFPVFKSVLYPQGATLKQTETAVGGSLVLAMDDAFHSKSDVIWSCSAEGVSINGNVLSVSSDCTSDKLTVTATNRYGSVKQFTVSVVLPTMVKGINQEINGIDASTKLRVNATGEIVYLTMGGKEVASYDYISGEGVTVPASAYPSAFGTHQLEVLTREGGEYTLTKFEVDYATMLISNKEELLQFANLSRTNNWGLGELYVLNADIDMQGADYGINVNTNGSNDNNNLYGFRGTFDGRGHVIKNINMVGNGFISGICRDTGILKNISFLNATQSGSGFIAANATHGGNIENIYIHVTPTGTDKKWAIGYDNYGTSRFKNVIVDVPYKTCDYYMQGNNYNRNYGSFVDVYGIGLNNENEYLISVRSANVNSVLDSTFVFDDINHFLKGGVDINGNAISYADMDNDFWDMVGGFPVPAKLKNLAPMILNTESGELDCGSTTIINTNAVPYGRLSIYDGVNGVTLDGNVLSVSEVAQGKTFSVQYVACVTGVSAKKTYTVETLVNKEVTKTYVNVGDVMQSATLTNGDFYSHNTGLALSNGSKQHSFNYYGVGGQASALTSINSQPNDIQLTDGGVAIQKDVLATEYYLEGILDSTTTAYKYKDGIAGLLAATGPKWVLSATTVESMRLQIGVLGNDILACSSWGWGQNDYGTFRGTETIKVCNWTESFTAQELASLNKSALKLGVLRYGSNNFAFFINDRYVGMRNFGNVNVSVTGFETYGQSAIGVVASYTSGGKLYNGGTSVLDFKYTTNATVINNLKAKVPTTNKTIDIYLIAGQSNAAGNAVFSTDTIRSKDATLVTGNENVLFYGAPTKYNWDVMKAGYGEGTNRIGAEAGMMNYLTSLTTGSGSNLKYTYDASEGRYAGIVKTAVGGTGFDYAHSTADQQNWLKTAGWWGSPSWISANGYNTATTPVRNLYNELVNAVVGAAKSLKDEGFETVRIKGLFWMQGERHIGSWGQEATDKNNTYYKAFNAFVTDLRSELNSKLGSVIGQNLTGLPVLIGEVSESFGTSGMDATAFNNKVTQNKKFVALQNFIAQNISNVKTLNTQAYQLNRLVNGKNYITGSQYSDHYHWGEDAMFAIGKMVGEKLYAF